MVPSSAADTTDGRSASPPRSRMTKGAPSFTQATRLLVVPRSMPTILDIFTPGAPGRRHLPLDAGEQVVDVVALENAFAEGLEHGTAFGVRRLAIDQRIPLSRELLELRFV